VEAAPPTCQGGTTRGEGRVASVKLVLAVLLSWGQRIHIVASATAEIIAHLKKSGQDCSEPVQGKDPDVSALSRT